MYPDSIFIESLQKMIMKYGKAEKIEKDEIVIYKWLLKDHGYVMLENWSEMNYVRVNMNARRLPENRLSVPPMARSIIPNFTIPDGAEAEDIKLDFKILSWYQIGLNWFNNSEECGLECPLAFK